MGIDARSTVGSVVVAGARVVVLDVLGAVVLEVVVEDEVVDDVVVVVVGDEMGDVVVDAGADVDAAVDGADESAIVAAALPQPARRPSAANEVTIRFRTTSTVSHDRVVAPFTPVGRFDHHCGAD